MDFGCNLDSGISMIKLSVQSGKIESFKAEPNQSKENSLDLEVPRMLFLKNNQQEANKKMVETRSQHRRRVTSQTWGKVEGAEDVFHDILSRLSVRSIRSFKTVNRYWHASIRNKHFATKQLAQSRKKPSYIACPRADKAMKLYLLKPGKFNYRHHATVDPPGRSAEHNMHMIASFNGLVCCINQLSDENEEDYQIWI
ncbi:hypothetical protein YC2023_067129 [Brassica napus]